jgi:aminoglycoside/choline kinase family phosphotransferase
MQKSSFHDWLAAYFKSTDFTLAPLVGDASFRHYFRITFSGKSWIAMDASAEKEKCPQFIAIAKALRAKGVRTPEIFTFEKSAGFILLEDFGDKLFLNQLNTTNAEALYGKALESLLMLSTCKTITAYTLPFFTASFMREEMNLFQEWFLEKYLRLTLSASTQNELSRVFDVLTESCATQPYVFMHRDYHSANLMVLSEDRVGVLDFQDAFIGPVTYDLVSLLRDCYIEWPDELVKKLVLHYHHMLAMNVSETEFLRWFDWMGVQRHLKALLTFSRKFCRDNNSHYLQHIPRTVNYVLRVSAQYPELKTLSNFIKENILEQLACVP